MNALLSMLFGLAGLYALIAMIRAIWSESSIITLLFRLPLRERHAIAPTITFREIRRELPLDAITWRSTFPVRSANHRRHHDLNGLTRRPVMFAGHP